MGDVAQILGIKSESNAALEKVATPVSGNKPPLKKLTGMQREVLGLMESSYRGHHAFYPSIPKQSLQQKWKAHKSIPAIKWKKLSFQNPARKDLPGENCPESSNERGPLILQHWVKAHNSGMEYTFARFNVTCVTTTYTNEEYVNCIEKYTDPLMKPWTRSQTDLLFQLCQQYDLRWFVIADRWFTYTQHDDVAPSTWTLEDLKYRYYELTRVLATYREKQNIADKAIKLDPQCNEAALSECPKNGSAPTAAIPSEESRPVQGSVSLSIDPQFSFNLLYEKQRKSQLERAFRRSIEEEKEIQALNEELRDLEQQLKKTAGKMDAKKKKELAVASLSAREFPVGVFLRSICVTNCPIKGKMLKKMQAVLRELGIPARPMPTQNVCEMFDTLRKDIVGLLSLRKHLEMKQKELSTLQNRYRSLTGETYEPVGIHPLKQADLETTILQGGLGEVEASQVSVNDTPTTFAGKAMKQAGKTARNASKRRNSAAIGSGFKRNKKA
ncbi:unnamed protein product [Albugo candida]|uniref:Myb-like domain-containing protein n=1 Tax=Albugo candida TaxID=65357 RepID=A0A024GHL0_9STRA|nr:unnamed protein product [Albugo candida]|eukprot:CCI45976.1 unnamed protein product [Albugo candida]